MFLIFPLLLALIFVTEMRFEALVEGELRPVTVRFGKDSDVRAVSRWRITKSPPLSVRDALEFARLASKRWRYYRRTIPCAESLPEFRAAAVRGNQQEISLILLAHADWF